MQAPSSPATAIASNASATELGSLLDRFASGSLTETDVDALVRADLADQIRFTADGDGAVVVGGSARGAIIITGDNNRVVRGPTAATIARALDRRREAWAADRHAKALRAYMRALRRFCLQLPYVAVDEITGGSRRRSLEQVYVPLLARSLQATEDSDQPALSKDANPTRREEQLVGIDQILQQASRGTSTQHVLLIGEPGAGKSTLLRFIAGRAWDEPDSVGLSRPHLPMLAPLQGLAVAAGAALDVRLKTALDSEGEIALTEELPADFIGEWSTRMNAPWLLLLDGLQDVPAADRSPLLRWLEAQVDLLAEEGRTVTVVISSRPLHPRPLLDGRFSTWVLAPLTRTQQEALCTASLGDHAPEFLAELERVGGSGFAETPLLLTLAAAVAQAAGSLPERRAKLYSDFVQVMLDEAERKGLAGAVGTRVAKVGRACLEQIARATTASAARTDIDEVSGVVAAYLRRALKLTNAEAEVDGRRCASALASLSGVLVHRGKAVGWVHSTFREYLAAAAVATYHGPRTSAGRELVELWPSETWRDVVLFALGIWSEQGLNVSGAIRAIATSGNEGLLFAGAAAADGATLDPELVADVVERLIHQASALHPDEVERAAGPFDVLGRLRRQPRAAEGLAELARSPNLDTTLREEAVWALLRLGRADLLLDLARDTRLDGSVRVEAARLFTRRANLAEILSLIRDRSVDSLVRLRAIWALDDQGEVDSLVELAWDPSLEPITRRAVLGVLAKAGHQTDLLLAIARSPRPDSEVRDDALSRLVDDPGGPNALWELSRDSAVDLSIRRSAVRCLGASGHTGLLIDVVRDATLDYSVRAAAVSQLQRAGCERELIAIALAAHTDPYLQREIIGVLGSAHLAYLSPLIHDAQSDTDVRRMALEAQAQTNAAMELVSIVHDAQLDLGVRSVAVDLLEQFARTDDLLALARQPELDSRLRTRAIRKLARLGRFDELYALAADASMDTYVRISAVLSIAESDHAEGLPELATNQGHDSAVRSAANASDPYDAPGLMEQAEQIKTWWDAGRVLDLEAALRSSKLDAAVDGLAISALIELGKPERVLDAALDPHVNLWTRGRAIFELAKICSSELLAALARERRLDSHVRLEAIDAISATESGTLEALVRSGDVDTEVRCAAVRKLSELGQTAALQDLLRDTSLDRRVCEEVLLVLLQGGDADAIWQIACASNARPDVRELAIRYMDDVDQLVTLVGDRDVDGRLRQRAVYALENLRQVDVLVALVRSVDIDTEMRYTAIHSLGRLTTSDQLRSLMLDDTLEVGVRDRVIFALAELGHADDLIRIARDQRIDQSLTWSAIFELGRLEEKQALAELLRATDLTLDARDRSVGMLSRLVSQAELAELASDPDLDTYIRGSVVHEMLSADDLLTLVLNTRVDTRVRQAAVFRLGRLGNLEQLQALQTDFAPTTVVGWSIGRALRSHA